MTETRTDFERILLELTMVSTAANAAVRCFALADAAAREERTDLVPEVLEAQAIAEVRSAVSHANTCLVLVREWAMCKPEARAVVPPSAPVMEAGS